MYFALSPQPATLSDANGELISSYRAVRDDPRGVIKLLRGYPHVSSYFYKVRRWRPRSRAQVAARFIYLNRTCWNGLYRVNSNGEFNTPFGRRENPDIVDLDSLMRTSQMLRAATLLHCDFEKAARRAEAGDFVYFDPPYITGHQNNGFLMYNAHLFSWSDQERLAKTAVGLAQKGVFVLVTNSDHRQVLKLYKGFHHYRVRRPSLIAGLIASRGIRTEAVLSSYPLLGVKSEVL